MKRCSTTKQRILQHALRRGEVQTSDTAAALPAVRVAIFGHDATSACKCSLVKNLDRQDCDEIGVFDKDNEHICTFHGREFRATTEPPTAEFPIGGLVIYRVPGGEEGTRDRNIVWAAETNRRHADFWGDR
jgi:hypothetical protein